MIPHFSSLLGMWPSVIPEVLTTPSEAKMLTPDLAKGFCRLLGNLLAALSLKKRKQVYKFKV